MIDEYQDTNRSQYELMRLLTEAHQNVCVVGDEDQSIYGWRGADIRNILDFERDFPNATVIRLEQNYRSTKNILEAASAVVANNTERKGKWLWTEAGRGREDRPLTKLSTPRTRRCSSPTPSSKLLAANPGDRVAVLYRTNFQSRQIEEALRRYGRKYVVVGGFSFYQRAEVKDVLAYLKAADQPAGFGQPAAHHQHAGARHRQEHHRADRAVRARARAERLDGDRPDARGETVSRRAPKRRCGVFTGMMEELAARAGRGEGRRLCCGRSWSAPATPGCSKRTTIRRPNRASAT